MLNASAWRPFPRYMAEPEEEASSSEITPQDHDLIVRYCIVGIFVILATASLHLTRVIALPVTAGVIFGLVLGPPVDAMVRRGVPQHLAAGLVVLAGVVLLLVLIGTLTVPIAAWSDQFPKMVAALQLKLVGVLAYMEEFKQFAENLSGKDGAKVSLSEGNPLVSIAISSTAAAGGLLIFVATVYFWLATRRHLKARALRLCLRRDARKSAGAFFEEIEARIARYFGLVTLINLGMGLIGLAIAWAAGLPYPVFWGALAFFLNYLAFIGPIIVAVAFFAAGLLSSPHFLVVVWPAAVYYVLHLVEGNLVTPLVVGSRLTISPFLVFISFVFWLWLWGPIGAVLSTPILLVGLVAREEVANYRQALQEAEQAAAEASAAEAPSGTAPALAR
ncbi:AI-2E family transporter [Bosea sp. CS1GBMeth4]|uniref:AI-2E family transporter n=1 Tax=Bosea sp. CS1GBMeth4 TaxID=1892849 RepID=UPI0016497927|nr:AI-2E family transporter [Bosea sp. CS1GBMeth4]